MADDDKVVRDGQVPADPPAVAPSEQTFKQAAASPKATSEGSSEWTASDSRGPLSTAEAERAERARTLDPAPAAGPTPEAPSGTHHDGAGPTALEGPGHEPTTPQISEPKSDSVSDPAESSNPEAEPPRPPISHIAQEAKRPLLPIAAGIVIGAAIGAGSAAFVYRSVQNDVVSDEVVRLASRVDALEKRPGSDANGAALEQKINGLDRKVAALGKGGGDAAPTALGPIEAKIAGLQSGLDALKAQSADVKGLGEKLSHIESDVAGMKNQASSAEAGVAEVQGQQKQLAGKVMVPALAVVADSLVQQIDRGQPYASQVDALAGLGADPTKLSVLRENAATGVPSAKALAAKFEPLAEPLTNVTHRAPADAGFMERLKSGMMSLVSVRRADDLSGNDPASRVARIKADLARDDVAAALASWDGLPAEAKAKGEAWRALAKTHADAMNAARGLQREAISALGGKKS